MRHAELRATIIGGKAVGVYAKLQGEISISRDLDIYLGVPDQHRLMRVVADVPGVVIDKRPEPRSLQVLVLDWKGLEVDVLVGSGGLPSAEKVFETAWKIGPLNDAKVADPFTLLKNKLAVRREKDEPHILLLRRFIIGQVRTFFESTEKGTRERIKPAQRFLDATSVRTLPLELFRSLVPFADASVGTFLVQVAPDLDAALNVAASVSGMERVLCRLAERLHPPSDS